MTQDKYALQKTEEDSTIKQIRRSIHRIENRLEHMLEKLEVCLETLTQKEENGLSESDLYSDETYEW